MAGDLGKPQEQGGKREQGEAAAVQAPGQALPTAEPGVRPHQGHAKEQVVVQQPVEAATSCRGQPLRLLSRVAWARLQELVFAEEAGDLLDIFCTELQRRILTDAGGDGLVIAERPPAEDLEGRPVEAEEAVAGGVVQRPAGLPVGQAWSRQQSQFFAQRQPIHGHHPMAARRLANGRRSAQ